MKQYSINLIETVYESHICSSMSEAGYDAKSVGASGSCFTAEEKGGGRKTARRDLLLIYV